MPVEEIVDRRTFLQQAGLGLAGTVAAGAGVAATVTPADAAPPSPALEAEERRIDKHLDRVHRRRDRMRTRIERKLRRVDEPEALEQAYARSVAALGAIEMLGHLPRRDQVHHRVQDAARQLFIDLGQGVLAVREALAATVEDGSEPDLEPQLGELDPSYLHDADTSDAARRVSRGTVAEIKAELRLEGLQGVARRHLRKLDRAVRLADHIAATGRGLKALEGTDPGTHATIEEGEARWGSRAAGVARKATGDGLVGVLILGIIVAGIAVLFAGYIVVGAISCAISCDAPGLFVVAIIGMLIIGLLIAGIVGMYRAVRKRLRRGTGSPYDVVPAYERRVGPVEPPPPTRASPREVATELCDARGIATDSPVHQELEVVLADAFGRGVSKADVRRLERQYVDMRVVALVITRLQYDGRRFAPSTAVRLVQGQYQRKDWVIERGPFEADIRAAESARIRGDSWGRIESGIARTKRPGQLTEVLGTR